MRTATHRKGEDRQVAKKSTHYPPVINTHSLELSLTDTVSVENNPIGLEVGCHIELDKKLPDHVRQVTDDLLPMFLDSNCC